MSEIDLVTGKPKKNSERELLAALTPEEKKAEKAARAAEKAGFIFVELSFCGI
jgi:hypothetical protein